MKFLDEHFKLIVVILQSLTFLLVFSIKINSCSMANDLRTTKKVTKSLDQTAKSLDEKTITREDLKKQTKEYLLKEKELDRVKDQDVQGFLDKDTIQ